MAMEICVDFMDLLQPDMSRTILMCLDDISDIVRASAVSRHWKHLVIENGLSKQLCLRSFPQLSGVASIVEIENCEMKEPEEVICSCSRDVESMQKDHRVFTFLARAFISFFVRNCISEAIIASSTDNFPEESIDNTLEPRDVVARRASYWSSKGQFNPDVPETLIYKLVSNFCVVTEIDIRPFQAFFQPGSPIYSAKSVRFSLGYAKPIMDVRSDPFGLFVSTYTSPEFPMAQDNCLQKFELPEPVLCIGGILQIELLGRVQRQETDALYYLCISHVQVVGQSLSPAFDMEILPTGKFLLRCNRQAKSCNQLSALENEPRTLRPTYIERRVRELQQIVNMLRGNGVQGNVLQGHVVQEDYVLDGDEDEEDSDGEFVA